MLPWCVEKKIENKNNYIINRLPSFFFLARF
jgi:hypothetical protein